MKNSTIAGGIVTLGLALSMSAPAFALDDYLRKEKDIINVFVKDGKLFCNRAEDKFEMCHGMAQEGEGWKGKKMKHPDMPGFMTFNGSVSFTDTTLTIKGCAVGNSMCDTEVWTKIAPVAENAEENAAATSSEETMPKPASE